MSLRSGSQLRRMLTALGPLGGASGLAGAAEVGGLAGRLGHVVLCMGLGTWQLR